MYKVLEEGLRKGDLEDLIYPIFEVDKFRSKMGEDQDVCVITFQAKDRYPAKDLMEFIEKGFSFVLDADVSSGENEEGEYSVFVEIERSKQIAEQVKELIYGISKLTNINEWKFQYYKDDTTREVTTENLKEVIPADGQMYEAKMAKFRVNEVKSFFSKTLMDNLELQDDLITIYKPFNKTVKLRWIKEGRTKDIIEGIDAPTQVDLAASSETFWLSKVLGDYNISKVGDNFLFTNGDKAMLLQRAD
tara:strand:- start:63 stop:803 length:741 start_codon:yes stop_codon:yes gene_type:complete